MLEPIQNQKDFERYSSAYTLSDMEIFIFPELMFALVLGNIMSPRIWAWRQDPWFAGIEGMSFNRKAQRLKQFIMDHYDFNLDLETWGLTTKKQELDRFASFVDPALLSRSNALFGYEGDKYYFDMDIRRHFGLDQYHADIIPYWKTETVEAMDAFRFKSGYANGAGECVSLAALYAAAMFIVLRVPLDDIFLMATPLHSQNFVALDQGLLTNNRRIVTKAMWTNGTELTNKARRALEKERVVIISHLSGHIHIDYPEATISPEAYQRFQDRLDRFLRTPLDFEVFVNFLRMHEHYRRYFQFEYQTEARRYYLPAEVLFRYEHGSKNRIGDRTRNRLLQEVETEEFDFQPIPGRHILNLLENSLNGRPLLCPQDDLCGVLADALPGFVEFEIFCATLKAFVCMHPRLPSPDKVWHLTPALHLTSGMNRDEIVAYLQTQRMKNSTVDLAFYAGRQVDGRGWEPFIKACLERNPVSINYFAGKSLESITTTLRNWPDASIYDEGGLATPDEVVNFCRGDGLEKALCFLNVARRQAPQIQWQLVWGSGQVAVKGDNQSTVFNTAKPIPAGLSSSVYFPPSFTNRQP